MPRVDPRTTSRVPRAEAAPSSPEVRKAERARAGMDERLKKAGVPSDQRERITSHLAKVSGEELVREVRSLDRALHSKAPRHAVEAYDRTLRVAGESPQAAGRVTPELREAIVAKAAAGEIGPNRAEEMARELVAMPADKYEAAASELLASENRRVVTRPERPRTTTTIVVGEEINRDRYQD
ncbi:MAG: hypothetical protein HYZ28_23925 [Myxococcales bacterium]|nr:hypothetical protein [Myxococcales bacterium]